MHGQGAARSRKPDTACSVLETGSGTRIVGATIRKGHFAFPVSTTSAAPTGNSPWWRIEDHRMPRRSGFPQPNLLLWIARSRPPYIMPKPIVALTCASRPRGSAGLPRGSTGALRTPRTKRQSAAATCRPARSARKRHPALLGQDNTAVRDDEGARDRRRLECRCGSRAPFIERSGPTRMGATNHWPNSATCRIRRCPMARRSPCNSSATSSTAHGSCSRVPSGSRGIEPELPPAFLARRTASPRCDRTSPQPSPDRRRSYTLRYCAPASDGDELWEPEIVDFGGHQISRPIEEKERDASAAFVIAVRRFERFVRKNWRPSPV